MADSPLAADVASSPYLLQARDLTVRFPGRHGTVTAVRDLNLGVSEGEFVSVVGPSGCGKTTLVRVLAGLMRPTDGEVLVAGQLVTRPPPGLVVVFQDYQKSLLPWRTVESNVRFALDNVRLSRAERRRRVDEALEAVGLSGAARQYPYQLSGGMQQRVAIARALARRPRIILMDEPFSSVDALTRGDLQDLTLRLWREHGQTIMFVTHDIDEAVYLANRILVLSRPASVRDVILVPIDGVRTQVATRESATFLAVRRHVHGLIRGEAVEDEARGDAIVSA